jgi:C4-dicarboxylate transporter DctQ subunit
MNGKSFFRRLESIVNAISLTANRIAIVALAVMVLLVTVDVIGRYFFSRPTYIADEVSGYALVAVIFLGLAYTQKLGKHVTSGILDTLLSPSKLRWLDLVTSILSLLFITYFAWNSATAAYESYVLQTTKQTILRTPYWIPQLFLPIGLSLFAFQLAVHVIKCINALQKTGATPGEVAEQPSK